MRYLSALMIVVCLAIASRTGAAQTSDLASAPCAALVWDPACGFERDTAQAIAAQIQNGGYRVVWLDWLELVDPAKLRAATPELVVLVNARSLPYAAIAPLQAYLRTGGHLVAMGLPAWGEGSFRLNGGWISRSRYEELLTHQKAEYRFADLAAERQSLWTRNCDRADNPATIDRVATEYGPAVHVVIGKVTGWDTYASPRLAAPVPAGHTLTCFRARGGPGTRQLAVEWMEQDGSRWIATVDLSPGWKQYALTPDKFIAWQPPAGRGAKGDRVQLAQAIRFTIGLAHSHTAIGPGAQEYWLADLGTAANPLGSSLPPVAEVPQWEPLCPDYLFFPVGGECSIRSALLPGFASETAIGKGSDLLAIHPRPRGSGFAQERPWRWQPLLEAYASKSPTQQVAGMARHGDGGSSADYRGALAALMIHRQAPFATGIWTGFTPATAAFYQQPGVLQLVGNLVTRLREGAFLVEGGSEFFTLFPGQSTRLGAIVANYSKAGSQRLEVHAAVRADQQVVFERTWGITLAKGKCEEVSVDWTPERWPVDGYEVTVELLRENKVVDRLAHRIHGWRPSATPQFIEARNGGLWLQGKPWKAHGVNYMPSSGIGVDTAYFEYWLGKGAYDPDVIERDLTRIQRMNLNAVSVFIHHRSLEALHLLDFLRRCDRHGLRVNLSLRPGTPLDFRWPEMKALIEHYRLAENDTVFAYDLAWEPSHYDRAHQLAYTPAWTAWVIRRYGDLAAAERAWGIPVPKPTSAAASTPQCEVPPSAQLTQDGPWRKRSADYRAFLDDFVGEPYARARSLVRSIDSHHPVSFRMQFAGDPTFNSEGLLPYDFHGLAGAVDIWEPEAYGRIGDWDQVKPGHFTAAYARLCDPGKPLIWAEMGTSVWDPSRVAPDPEKLDFTARYYADFYRLLDQSGADGIFYWWYPGGYRLNEKSDYGIINPDGTDRPVTRVIRSEGLKFLKSQKPPAPSYWITVDRDADARGLFGIYQAVRAEYWSAVEAGKTPGLKWRDLPGRGVAGTPARAAE